MSDIPGFLNAPQEDEKPAEPAAPPEKADYIEPLPAGMLEPGNIDLNKRERIPTGDGGYATVRSMSFGSDKGETLIPTAADGKILTEEEAIARYEKTGEHLGIFKTPEDADAYAKQLHRDQAIQYDPETKARRQGYTWPEINDHIATSTAAALDAGYSGDEIDRFLGRQDPTRFEDRSRAQWAEAMAVDPAMLADIDKGQLSLDAIPTMRSDYAAALLSNEVRGPQDFAYRYAAAALDAAHNDLGLDDSNAQGVRQKQAQGAFAAEAVAAGLPTREDLTDATVALTAADRESDSDQVRTNLLNHWLQTGQHPTQAAMQAEQDAGLNDKLMSPPPMSDPGLFDYIAQAQRGDQVSPEALSPAAFNMLGNLIAQHFKGIVKDAGDWGEAQQAIADRLEGKPLGERIRDPQAMETAFNVAFGSMPGNIGRVTADLVRGLPEPKIVVTDLTKVPGDAISEAPITEALKPVEPAKFEHEVTQGAPTEPGAEPAPIRFVADSTPAERIARIAQDAGEEPISSPTFFEDKLADMGETDPATVALAKANDATARIGKWFSDVFYDEGGAGPGIPTPSGEVQSGTYRARVVAKDYAEDLIRHISTGLGTQRSENIAQGFEQFFKDLAPMMPRFRQEMAKPQGGAWAETELGRVLRAIEGDGVVAPGPAAPYVAYRAQQNAKMVSDIEAAVARGDLDKFQARDFYLAHMYTRDSIYGAPGVTVGGRTGSQGWRNERTFPTYADAFGEGYKPLYDNPILIDIASADAHYKVLDTVRMQSMAREANMMRYYQSAREAARDDFYPLTGLNSLKEASSINPDGTPGPVIRQQLYGKSGLDTIWNRWDRFENRNRYEAEATIEDALLKVKNTSTYSKLLFPGYHTGTEYKLGMSNGFANAFTELGYALKWNLPEGGPSRLGEIARGMRDLVAAPVKPVQYLATSAVKWRPMYRAMEADPALDAFVGGGGGIAARSKVYNASDSPGIWKLWNRGQLFQELAAEMRRDFTFPNTRVGDGTWGVATGGARDVTNLATLPFRATAYGVTNLSAPVWDHMVPLLKAGASIERIQTFIRQNPKATDDMWRVFGQRVVTNTEDRMGEYNPANLFWRPWMKRIANVTMLSTAWTPGTIHATMAAFRLGRGFRWDPVATTNLMGQVATIAFTNAAWSLLIDGKMPNSTLDYLIPFATVRGLARVLLPGEEKEYYDWMKIIADTYAGYKTGGVFGGAHAFGVASAQYAEGKLAPIWQAVTAFLGETDRIGRHIADQPNAFINFLRQSFGPIFFENWDKAKSIGLNAGENLFGLREAPKQLSDFWGYVANQEKLHTRWSKEELARAGKEAVALGETPPEGYRPSTRGTGTTRSAASASSHTGGYTLPSITRSAQAASPQQYGYAPAAQSSIGGGAEGVTDLTPRPAPAARRTYAPRGASRARAPTIRAPRAPVIRRGRRVR